MHSLFWKETLPTTEVGGACYSMDEGHVDYVLAIESLPCKKSPRGQLDVTLPISILEENKSQGEPSSSSQDRSILK